jgi:hypothetical protein
MSRFTGNDAFLTCEITDISTADQVYVPVTEGLGGEVIEIRSVIHGAIATADAVLTAKIGGTAMTNGTITVANSSSAAGDTDVCTPSGLNYVSPGDAIEIETDGASTNTVAVTLTIVIRR